LDNGSLDNGGSGSLTDAQRESIEETLQTLRIALEDIRERMIELFDQPLVANSTSGEMVATWLAQQREFSELRRERTEASARAARRVLGQIEDDRERTAAALRRFLQ